MFNPIKQAGQSLFEDSSLFFKKGSREVLVWVRREEETL